MTLASMLQLGQVEPPVVLRTPLSRYDISWNLQKLANDWRDSAIPEELREIGINKLLLEDVGEDLTLEWRGHTNPVNNPACFVTIVPLPTGGAEVTVRFGRGSLQVFALLALLTSPLQGLGDERGPMRWFFVAAQFTISLAFLITGRSRTPLLKAHLMKVVERATRQKASAQDNRNLAGA